MEAFIREKLREIQRRENCRILLAVESGSRAWGFASPFVYPFAESLRSAMRRYFLPRSGLRHYLQMAEGNYRESLLGGMVKAKKYFYALRPVLACRWILEKGIPPPLRFRLRRKLRSGENFFALRRDSLRWIRSGGGRGMRVAALLLLGAKARRLFFTGGGPFGC